MGAVESATPASLPQTVEAQAEAQAARRAQDAITDIVSNSYDRAAAYTNLLIAAGYAGAFAIWNFTRDQLSDRETILIASLLSVSLATFVFFEVYKMVITALSLRKEIALITEGHQPREFLRRLEILQREQKRGKLKALYKIWMAVVFVCVISALSALAILFRSFFSILLSP